MVERVYLVDIIAVQAVVKEVVERVYLVDVIAVQAVVKEAELFTL